MNLNTDRLHEDGYTEAEIHRIQQYCDKAVHEGHFSHDAALVHFKTGSQLCCVTIAEIMDQVRPGCWLDRPEAVKPKKRSGRHNPMRRMLKTRMQEKRRTSKPNLRRGALIKVNFSYPDPMPDFPAGEYLWARRISRNTAKIHNIPFCTSRLAYGDLVRFNRDLEITKILEHVARTRMLIYGNPKEQSPEELVERFGKVKELLSKYDIHLEGMLPGICSTSVPNDIADEQLQILADQLGARQIVHEDAAETDIQ